MEISCEIGHCHKCGQKLKDNWNFCPICKTNVDFYEKELIIEKPVIKKNIIEKDNVSTLLEQDTESKNNDEPIFSSDDKIHYKTVCILYIVNYIVLPIIYYNLIYNRKILFISSNPMMGLLGLTFISDIIIGMILGSKNSSKTIAFYILFSLVHPIINYSCLVFYGYFVGIIEIIFKPLLEIFSGKYIFSFLFILILQRISPFNDVGYILAGINYLPVALGLGIALQQTIQDVMIKKEVVNKID